MITSRPPLRLPRAVTHSDVRTCLGRLSIQSSRSITSTSRKSAVPSIHGPTRRSTTSPSTGADRDATTKLASPDGPVVKQLTAAERAELAAKRARDDLKTAQERFAQNRQLGGLADNNVFHDEEEGIAKQEQAPTGQPLTVADRNYANMAATINPRPNTRARWQRKMVIRHIQRRGRLPRQVQIARTERQHLAKSHFFKTSVKKLAPLARQIAGKTIDEAILQMRFSKKKAAIEVRNHLVQARDEAIVIKGMGLSGQSQEAEIESPSSISPVRIDTGMSPPLPDQTAAKTRKPGLARRETDIYIAQAWVGRGPYGKEPEYRARGRVNILRPPWTSLSVLLKEQKTKVREEAEKEAKATRKRMGKSMWVQLPDRPITRQSQHVLW